MAMKLLYKDEKLALYMTGKDINPPAAKKAGGKWNPALRRWEYPFTYDAYTAIMANLNPEHSEKLALYMERERLKREVLTSYSQQEDCSPLDFKWSGMHQLFGYQRVGVKFLLETEQALLADVMGLGKTLQAIATIKNMEIDKGWTNQPYLVICPNSLKLNWKHEIEHWCGDPVFIVQGGAAQRKKVLNAFFESVQERSSWLVINWESLRTYYDFRDEHKKLTHWSTLPTKVEWPFEKTKWGAIVRDEAHRGRHRTAQQTRATFDLATKTTIKLDLTGTPIYNRPDDLWAILRYLRPKEFTSYWRFVEEYCEMGVDFMGHKIVGALRRDKVQELQDKLAPIMIRRTKEQVLKDLPAKLPPQTIYVELEGEQAKQYNKMQDEMLIWLEEQEEEIASPTVLSQLQRLKQLAGSLEIFYPDDMIQGKHSVKLDALADIIDDTDEKLIVFTVYKNMAKAAQRRLELMGVTSCVFTGDSSMTQRNDMVEAFQSEDGPRVFIATIRAGGVGLTLTAASTVIFLDREWSPSDNDQAEDRAHRIGQTKEVRIINILAEGTVDTTKIDPTLKFKKSEIVAILGKGT